MIMDKSALRLSLREKRRAFVSSLHNTDFQPLHAVSCLKPLIDDSTILSFYQSDADECSVQNLALDLTDRLALPCANRKEDRLIFRLWSPGDALEMSPLGFRQPVSFAERGAPSIILTPLLGFDRALNRLGQGAGHYDRAFEDYPDAIRIGIAWSVQEVSALTPDLWDMPLDAILTEREWIIAPSSRLDLTS